MRRSLAGPPQQDSCQHQKSDIEEGCVVPGEALTHHLRGALVRDQARGAEEHRGDLQVI